MRIAAQLAIPVTALLLLAVPAHAQEPKITEAEVEDYLRQIGQDATDMVRAGDRQQMTAWTENHVSDDAVFEADMHLLSGDERKGFAAIRVDKEDMLRLGGIFAGALGKKLESYALELEISDVTVHGSGAATATVRWIERVSVDAAGAGNGSRPKAAPLAAETVADCTHLIQRDGDRLQLGLTTCTAEMRL